jgi:hypothetical protein
MRVKVIDYNTGAPIEGAYVYLNGYTGFTGKDGIAVIDVPLGTYELRVTHRDYDPLATKVSISTKEALVTVKLIPLAWLL